MQKKIFIVGCGRTGTHLMAQILDSHPDIKGGQENPVLLRQITNYAMGSCGPIALNSIVAQLEDNIKSVYPSTYLDKHHPNLWLLPEINQQFSDVKFIAMKRSAYATIASMISHPGVTDHTKRWSPDSPDNRFLGTFAGTQYDTLTLAQKHALRYAAHMKRINSDVRYSDADIMPVVYEDLVTSPKETVAKVADFVGYDPGDFEVPYMDKSTTYKWRRVLTVQDTLDIDEILEQECLYKL